MTTKKAEKGSEETERIISFTCQRCHQVKPIDDMRILTRFFPLLTVCKECEKEMH